MHALIVDDEDQIQKLLQRFCEWNGCQVRLAADGREALNAIQEVYPDILITDMNMPEMDGIELLERLAKTGSMPPLTILFSGYITESIEKRALACGVSAVLPKTAIDELFEVIEKAVAKP